MIINHTVFAQYTILGINPSSFKHGSYMDYLPERFKDFKTGIDFLLSTISSFLLYYFFQHGENIADSPRVREQGDGVTTPELAQQDGYCRCEQNSVDCNSENYFE